MFPLAVVGSVIVIATASAPAVAHGTIAPKHSPDAWQGRSSLSPHSVTSPAQGIRRELVKPDRQNTAPLKTRPKGVVYPRPKFRTGPSLEEAGVLEETAHSRLLRREARPPIDKEGNSLALEDQAHTVMVSPDAISPGQSFVITASGSDCPNNTFPIQDPITCMRARDYINAYSGKILMTPAFGNPNVSVSMPDHPSGCFLHCRKQVECEAFFNIAAGKMGDPKDRRYCQDFFLHSTGQCRHKEGRYRRMLSRGTYPSVEACKTECLSGPLHRDWCDSFEVVDPFSNECLFFKDGYVGDRRMGQKCYVRTASGH